MSSGGQVVGGVVGAVAGFFLGGGPTGALYGAQIGMMAGGYLDPPKGPTIEGPRLNDLSVQTSTYGAVIPRVYGTVTVNGNVFWLENNQIKPTYTRKKSGGKGGGSKTTTGSWSYSATFAVGLCKGPIAGVRRIWVGPDLIYDAGSSDPNTIAASNAASSGFHVYLGTDTQLPDSRMQATLGVANTPAWRGLAYIVFYDLALARYANSLAGAQVRVEVMTLGATYAYPVVAATAPGYYWQEPAWDGTVYCAISYFYNALAICTDGVSWVESTLPSSRSYLTGWQGVASDGNGTLLVYGVNEIWRSTDHGAHWTNCPNGYAGYTTQIVWSGSYWLCITDSGSFYTSPTGQSWTAQTPPAGAGSYARSLVWNAAFGLWSVIPQFGGGVRIYTSPSGNTGSWTLRKTFSVDENNFACGTAMNGILVYMGVGTVSGVYNDHAYISTDGGGTWTGYAVVLGRESITNNGKVFLVTNNSGYFTSTDGASWSAITLWPVAGQAAWVACTPPTGPLGFAVVGPGVYAAFIYEQFVSSIFPTLANVVSAECLQSGLLTGGDIDVTALTSSVRGYRIGSVGAIRSALEPLQASWPFDVVQHGYVIRFVARGGASVVTIPAGDLDARGAGQEPGVQITTSREMDSQLPRRVTVQHLDYDREYNTGTQYAERLNTAAINARVLDLPIVLTATEAAGKAEVLLYLYWLERYDVAVTLPPTYNQLEPGDVVTLITPEGDLVVRLTAINYTSDGRLECKAKYANPAVYLPTAVAAAPAVSGPTTITPVGASVYHLLDLPLVSSAQSGPSFLAAMTGALAGWGGGVLMQSTDAGANWSSIEEFGAPGATIGTCSNSLGVVDSRAVDNASRLSVTLTQGELFDVTQLAMFGGANHFAYGADGRWEIIAAQTCTLVSGKSYVLQNLLRGRYGSEWAMSTHANGDALILLDSTDVAAIAMSADRIGLSFLYRGLTVDRDLSTDSNRAFTYQGVNLKPLSPIALTGARDPSTGDWTITAVRRTRTGSEWRDYVDADLGESSEAYQMDIFADGTYAAVKRTLSNNVLVFVYSSAAQVADFGSNQTTLNYDVFQMSSVVGRGYALRGSITR